MTKQCTCKDGKKCEACSKKHSYLDSHHKLNPGSEPVKKAMQKIAYGRYGEDHDEHSVLPDLTTLALLGGGGALAHSALMNSRGQFARGYQQHLGNTIRETANKYVRKPLGMDPVSLPPGRIAGGLIDAKDAVVGGLQNLKGLSDAYGPLVRNATGLAATGVAGHNWLMDSNKAYKGFVRRHLWADDNKRVQKRYGGPTTARRAYEAAKQTGQDAAGAVRGVAQSAADAVRNAAAKLRVPGNPAAQAQQAPPPPKAKPKAAAKPKAKAGKKP